MTTTAIIEVVNEHWSDYLPCIKTEYPLNENNAIKCYSNNFILCSQG